MLAMDTFSSDAIPVSLLTREAFTNYLKHLRSEPERQGILRVNVTNWDVDPLPVSQGLATEYDLEIARFCFETSESY